MDFWELSGSSSNTTSNTCLPGTREIVVGLTRISSLFLHQRDQVNHLVQSCSGTVVFTNFYFNTQYEGKQYERKLI